ncbi:MAG: Hsp33 family molecular chaperone HslO, partial [Oxalobacteraceae bacterium]
EAVAALAQTVKDAELADPALPLETVAWRLFNEEEVRVLPPALLARGCRCNPAHIRDVIARFPPDERAGMADAEGNIKVDCEFCASTYLIPAELDA